MFFIIKVLYHHNWFNAIDSVKTGLNASLLVRHPHKPVSPLAACQLTLKMYSTFQTYSQQGQ